MDNKDKTKKPKLDKSKLFGRIIALIMVIMMLVGFAATLIFYLLQR